jgi:arylsulfatase A-like enzyme
LKKKNYKLLLSSWIDKASFSKEKIQCHDTPRLSYNGDEDEDWDKIRNAIEESPKRPLFVYLHMKGGHDPWSLPEEELIFGKGKQDTYDALLYKADRQFGDILENLRKLNIYENSIIIFSSDHGIGLGKHLDRNSYSRTYNVNLQIPFLIKIPGVNASQVSNIYSLIDIRPSLEELLGIQNNEPLHGVSFVSEFNSSGFQNERCVFGIAAFRNYFSMQCSSGMKIIYQKDYDFLDMFNSFSDPWELSSLIDQYSTENFEKMAHPFIKFIAYGEKSYAFTK